MQFISPNAMGISVEITASNGSTPAVTPFPTQEDLQDCKIVAVEAFSAVDMPYDPLNSGIPILSVPLFNACYLSIYTSAVKGNQPWNKNQQPGLFYDYIPLNVMRPVINYTGFIQQPSNMVSGKFLIRPTELAFNKCKIQFPTPVAMTSTYSAFFVFHYLDKGDDGVSWMRYMGYNFEK